MDVIDEEALDLRLFISSTDTVASSGMEITPYHYWKNLKGQHSCDICSYLPADEVQICENVTLALDYKFYWKGNGISSIILTRTVGTITLNNSSKYSCVLHFWFWFLSVTLDVFIHYGLISAVLCTSSTVPLTTRYSAVFLNGEPVGEPNSGNPGETQDEMPFLRMAV